ncbi:MAG: serine/threonine protein kinase, partial [Deltaproteobacteria bacterium]|nr:serine/threonine protein kinase [Deltaproteobacteria bacterium]
MQTTVETIGEFTEPDARDALRIGATAGPWRVEGELGRGGMGTVYAVVHDEIGKRAALKVMHHRMLESGAHAHRSLLEARVVNQVRHPGIVDIFETGTLPDGRPYIVMEHLEGMTLGERARACKILPDEVIAILLQLCDALIAAHAVGVIHRDLKLDNVFLLEGPGPRVKLLDWSIAKVITSQLWQTVEGFIAGTPHYLAPEQAAGRPVTPQTDVYSLGVMAYVLFMEQLPFEAETVAEVLVMHLKAAPPPPRELWPEIPWQLENLMMAMLAKDPYVRPRLPQVVAQLEAAMVEITRRRAVTHFSRSIRKIDRPALAPRPRRFGRTTRGALACAVALSAMAMRDNGAARDAVVMPSAARGPTSRPELDESVTFAITSPPTSSRADSTPLDDAPVVRKVKPKPNKPKPTTRKRPVVVRQAQPRAAVVPRAQVVTAESLVAQYQAVGQKLQALQDARGSMATLDLWPRYRLIQINVAVASPE